jgi:hypothetical protein
VQLVGVVGK